MFYHGAVHEAPPVGVFHPLSLLNSNPYVHGDAIVQSNRSHLWRKGLESPRAKVLLWKLYIAVSHSTLKHLQWVKQQCWKLAERFVVK